MADQDLTADLVVLGARTDVSLRDRGSIRIEQFHRDPAGRLVAVVKDGDVIREVPYQRLVAELTDAPRRPPELHELLQPPAMFQSLPQERQALLLEEAQHLLQVLTGSLRGFPELDRVEGQLDARYDPLTTTRSQRVNQKIADLRGANKSVRSRSQVFRRLQRFSSLGLQGLVHRNTKPVAAPISGVSPEALESLRYFIASREGQARISNRRLVSLAMAHLQTEGIELRMTDHQATNLIAHLSRGKGIQRAASSQANRYRPEGVHSRLAGTRPGELVQMDATPTTIHCYFPDVGWARANILTAVDTYSRCILAMRVVAGAVTSRDVGQLLFSMANPVVRRAGWPFEHQLYHGVPRYVLITMQDGQPRAEVPSVLGMKPSANPCTVVMDNGRENTSLHIRAAAQRAGIGLIFTPPLAPHTKGIVESLHRMFVEVQSLLPGFKGANPTNHPKGIENEALLTVGDLQDALWEYVLNVYHHTPHEGLADPDHPLLKATPSAVFERHLTKGGTIELPTNPLRMLDFLSSAQRVVNDYGINLERRIYNSPELLMMRDQVQAGAGSKAKKVLVFYDRWDVSRIFVQDPSTGGVFCVPRHDPDHLSLPPYSELLTHAAITKELSEGRSALSPSELHRAEAKLAAAWSRGVFEDRREARMAALSAARNAQYAFDLECATDEYRALTNSTSGDEVPDVDPLALDGTDNPLYYTDTDESWVWQ